MRPVNSKPLCAPSLSVLFFILLLLGFVASATGVVAVEDEQVKGQTAEIAAADSISVRDLLTLTSQPTKRPSTLKPSRFPTLLPTKRPTSSKPSKRPTSTPTTRAVTGSPTKRPTSLPTTRPSSNSPTKRPTTQRPTSVAPTKRPTGTPTISKSPTKRPTRIPTSRPTTGTPTTRPTKRCAPEDVRCGFNHCMPNGATCCDTRNGIYCPASSTCLRKASLIWECCAWGVCNGKCCLCDFSKEKLCGGKCIPKDMTCCSRTSDCASNNVCTLVVPPTPNTPAVRICQDCGNRGVCGSTCCACDGKPTPVTAPLCQGDVPVCCKNTFTNQWGCIPLLSKCCADGTSCTQSPSTSEDCCTARR